MVKESQNQILKKQGIKGFEFSFKKKDLSRAALAVAEASKLRFQLDLIIFNVSQVRLVLDALHIIKPWVSPVTEITHIETNYSKEEEIYEVYFSVDGINYKIMDSFESSAENFIYCNDRLGIEEIDYDNEKVVFTDFTSQSYFDFFVDLDLDPYSVKKYITYHIMMDEKRVEENQLVKEINQ